MKDSVMQQVLNKQKTSRPPIWFMRQAGRVLPSYLALREKYDFKMMMQTPELAAQVTLLPYHDLGVDALILFNDILVIPEALGMPLEFTNKGPVFPKPLSSHPEEISRLTFQHEKLQHVYNAIDQIIASKPAHLPLIGFCGAPFTVFCYMVQGVSTGHSFTNAIKMLYQSPALAANILEKITLLSIEYAVKQIEHGVDAFQLFESHAGLLPANIYHEIMLPYALRILDAVKAAGGKTIFFPKGLGHGINSLSSKNIDFLGLDWQFSIDSMRKIVAPEIGLQGNLDPRLLLADQATIAKHLEEFIAFGRDNYNWIFNLGHGLIPEIPFENVKFTVDWLKNANWQRDNF
ncbi:MAG: uroporphyrinogen decarboxylase [Lentisphaeria bacterium]